MRVGKILLVLAKSMDSKRPSRPVSCLLFWGCLLLCNVFNNFNDDSESEMDRCRGASSKSKLLNVPFYEVPANIKTSSDIIREARDAVRPVDTKRPFTPREDGRRLFGNVSRQTRPPSVCKLDHLVYDSSESRLSTPTQLEPLEVKVHRTHSSSHTKLEEPRQRRTPKHVPCLEPDEVLVGRKISSAPGRVRLPALSAGRNLHKLSEERTIKECEEKKNKNKFVDVENKSGEIQSQLNTIKEQDLLKRASTTRKSNSAEKSKLSSVASSTTPEDKTCIQEHEILKENKEDNTFYTTNVLPILGQIVKKENGDDVDIKTCAAVKNLFSALNEGELLGKSFKHRSTVLKIVFKLFDTKSMSLVLQAARICLSMNVTGNNLTAVSKILFKVSKNDSNDSLFLEDNILEPFLESIQSMNPLKDTDALIYGVGSLKCLSMNPSILRELSKLETVQVLSNHLKQVNNQAAQFGQFQHDQVYHVIFQITGCLRNLAENSCNRKEFVNAGTIQELCQILILFPDDPDIIMNVARILSKLTMYYEVCNVMADNERCFPAVIHLLDVYKTKQDLVVRLLFAFGNIVAKNENARQTLFGTPGCVDTLVELLRANLDPTVESNFVDRQRDLKGFVSTSNSTTESKMVSDSKVAPEDVVIKTIRLLANLTISVDVGKNIAQHDDCLALLISIIGNKNPENHEELVLSSIAALSNLSYYSLDSTNFTTRLCEVIECLYRYLSTNHKDMLIECLRVLGNISRTNDARKHLAAKKVIETTVGLLESDNKDVIYLSCGLLMNFMVDNENREILKKENGLKRILSILREVGCQDWQLSSIVCQTLWNYTCEPNNAKYPLECKDADELKTLLLDYLGKRQSEDDHRAEKGNRNQQIDYDIWLLDFCPVATRLLHRIQPEIYSLNEN